MMEFGEILSTIVGVLILVGMVLFVVYIVQSCTRDQNVEHQCLEAGYPRFAIRDGDAYCIKIMDNTEVVIPLEQAIAGSSGQ